MNLIKLSGAIKPLDNRTSTRGIMTTQITVGELLENYEINSEVNRDINITRLPKIQKYIDTYKDDIGIFFPAIMCNVNIKDINSSNYKDDYLILSPGDKLLVIDGQHRIKGLEKYLATMKVNDYRRTELLNSTLTLQLYINLNKSEQRELFTSINSNAKKVSMSLTTSYDSRDILNVLATDLYGISKALQTLGVEKNKSKISRPTNTNLLTMIRLKTFIALLIFGKKQLSNENEKLIKKHYDDILNFLQEFFKLFAEQLPTEPGDVKQYVLGHEAILNAIAINLNKKIISAYNTGFHMHHDLSEVLENVGNIDFSIENFIWSKYIEIAQKGKNTEFYTIDIKNYNHLTLVLDDLLQSNSNKTFK